MSFKLGRIFGIPVSVDVSWFIVFLLITYTLATAYFPKSMSPELRWFSGAIAALLLFGSVLLHELMHCVVAKKNGIGISGITLFIFGGVSKMTGEPGTPGSEFKMAVAGPATSIALSIIFFAISMLGRHVLGQVAYQIVFYLAAINLTLGIFNLIPAFPLDGGRVFRSIIWAYTHNYDKATRIAAGIGQGFGYLFIAGGVAFMLLVPGGFLSGLWLAFIGWFLNNAAVQSYQQVTLKNALSGVTVETVMTSDFPHVNPNSTIDEFVHDYLLRYDYAVFPVTEDDNLLGTITVNEVRNVPRDHWQTVTVRELAKPVDQDKIIDENDDAFDALTHMASGDDRRLLVMHEGKLKGMVTQDSIVHLIRAKLALG
jgi:Zn-dependent protease/CBS domain-containing protein